MPTLFNNFNGKYYSWTNTTRRVIQNEDLEEKNGAEITRKSDVSISGNFGSPERLELEGSWIPKIHKF
jgi:hypothetical protein